MFSSGAEKPPFVTFIDTSTHTPVGKLSLPDATGLEACVYDEAHARFMMNNDGGPDATLCHLESNLIQRRFERSDVRLIHHNVASPEPGLIGIRQEPIDQVIQILC